MRLVGVGVGPGDPDLVTVKAVRELEAADLVLVPVMREDDQGRAERTVRTHVGHDRIRRVVFALDDRGGVTARREAAWDVAADAVLGAFQAGTATVAFATIGDPNVYSTFSYLAQTVRERAAGAGLGTPEVATVPGITAMQDLAARSGTVLCEGTESLALLPLTAGTGALRAALATFDTVVGYKGGRTLPDVLRVVRDAGRLDGAVVGANLGLEAESIRPASSYDATASGDGESAPYLSTLLVPGRRTSRGARL